MITRILHCCDFSIYSWVCNSAYFGIFGVSQTPSLVSTPKIPKNYESHTAIISIVFLLYLQMIRIVGYCKIYTIHKIRTFFNKQSNSSICGGSFVFGENFGDKTRLGVCCSPKFSPSAKGAPKDEFNNAKEHK